MSGFVGKQLLNSFDKGGDGLTGIIQSPEFNIGEKISEVSGRWRQSG